MHKDNEDHSELDGSVWWEERTLHCSFCFIISLYFRELINSLSDIAQVGVLSIKIGGNFLNIMGEFCEVEIGKGQIAKSK